MKNIKNIVSPFVADDAIVKKVGNVVVTMHYEDIGWNWDFNLNEPHYILYKQEFESANRFKEKVFEHYMIAAAESYAGDEACWDFDETMEQIDSYYMEKAYDLLKYVGFKDEEI